MTTSVVHTVDYERVDGERRGYVVTCSCGFRCERHYRDSGAAACANDHMRRAEREQLLVAAPDLLAALKLARKTITCFMAPTAGSMAASIFADIDAAIDKATGASR